MTDPIQASSVSPETIARLEKSIADTRISWDRLSLQHRIMMAIATTIENAIPSWLQLGPIAQFVVAARFLDQQYLKIGGSLAWFEQVPGWVSTGAVTLRPSARDSSDVDIVIRSSEVPVPPFAQEVQTLGAWWIAFGAIAGLAGLKITTDFMSVQEATQRKQIEFLIVKRVVDALEAGTLSETTAQRLIGQIKGWKDAAPPGQGAIDQLTTLAKWGVGVALLVGAIGIAWKWAERD